VAESAFSSLKNEFCHHHSLTTRQEARRGVMKYIEVFYDRWRPHSNNNDGLPPATAMAAFMPTAQPLPAAALPKRNYATVSHFWHTSFPAEVEAAHFTEATPNAIAA
jgi:hypothetical protein